MKLSHPKLAGLKLNTVWGVLQVDAEGCVEVADKSACEALIADGWTKIGKSKKEDVSVEVSQPETPAAEAPTAEDTPEDKSDKKSSRWQRSR